MYLLPRILIVEDDEILCGRLEKLLEAEKYTVDATNDGADGLAMLQQYQYDIAILDWNLPSMKGPEIVRNYREHGGATRIIMLTGEDAISNKEQGYDAGVDDYLTKPFHLKELTLRLKALLRRPNEQPTKTLTVGELSIDVESHIVVFAGVTLKLQKLEFALLEYLMRNVGKVFSAEILLERVWPADSEASIETLRGYIKTLKKKMVAVSEKPSIRNLHGVGYKLDPME